MKLLPVHRTSVSGIPVAANTRKWTTGSGARAAGTATRAAIAVAAIPASRSISGVSDRLPTTWIGATPSFLLDRVNAAYVRLTWLLPRANRQRGWSDRTDSTGGT